MTSTELLFLQGEKHISVGQRFANHLSLVTDYQYLFLDSCPAGVFHDMIHDIPAVQPMQDLGKIGLHPFAFSGTQYEGYFIAIRGQSETPYS
jgi:hypothetical protein